VKAIILAAGYATRLYPYTKDLPKALLPIAGKPIIEYTIQKIAECNDIEKIYIVTNNKFFEKSKSWLVEYQDQLQTKTVPAIEIINDGTNSNRERLGSIGDLWLVIESKELADDLMVICSDKMFEFSLTDFVDFFKDRRAAVNTCCDVGDIELLRNKHGCVVVNEQGRIVEFQEKPAQPKSTIESIAFYIFPGSTIHLIKQYLSKDNNMDAPGFLVQWLANKVSMYAFLFTEECYDIGNPDAYHRVNEIYNDKTRSGGT
jgi:glucose-1-phosphate thymidylyltransferase